MEFEWKMYLMVIKNLLQALYPPVCNMDYKTMNLFYSTIYIKHILLLESKKPCKD